MRRRKKNWDFVPEIKINSVRTCNTSSNRSRFLCSYNVIMRHYSLKNSHRNKKKHNEKYDFWNQTAT